MTAAPPIRRAIYDRVAVALDREPILAEIDDLLGEFERARGAAQYALLRRLARSRASRNYDSVSRRDQAPLARRQRICPYIADTINATPAHEVRDLGGILQALRADVAAGYTRTLEELVHADLFSAVLELAGELA